MASLPFEAVLALALLVNPATNTECYFLFPLGLLFTQPRELYKQPVCASQRQKLLRSGRRGGNDFLGVMWELGS